MRVCGEIARHPARRVGREAGVRGGLAALREVSAQAGLEDSAGVVLVVSTARSVSNSCSAGASALRPGSVVRRKIG